VKYSAASMWEINVGQEPRTPLPRRSPAGHTSYQPWSVVQAAEENA
jgi:hypothetical protein